MDEHFNRMLAPALPSAGQNQRAANGSSSSSSSAPIIAYQPAQKFMGSRPGYFFTRGENGLGYYYDVTVATNIKKRPRNSKSEDDGGEEDGEDTEYAAAASSKSSSSSSSRAALLAKLARGVELDPYSGETVTAVTCPCQSFLSPSAFPSIYPINRPFESSYVAQREGHVAMYCM